MANFLNAGILGDGAGVANRRGFRAISTQYLDPPSYNAKYFETYPTVWASAYAFGKMLAAESELAGTSTLNKELLTAMEAATQEWVCLFLLLYYGDLHVVSYDRAKLEREYDKDLWLALSGTYPVSGEGALPDIQLVETNARTVVGGYYSETVLFPSRGRLRWQNDAKLAPYLEGTQLSWKQSSDLLLKSEGERRDFHGHLQLIAKYALPSKVFQDRLRQFCAANFFGDVEPTGTLSINISSEGWTRSKEPPPEDFLKHYPIQKANEFGGTTYYLVSGIPPENRTAWMTTSTSVGPAPFQYAEPDRSFGQITVPFRGKSIVCKLAEHDRVVQLHKLLLTDAPFWCKIPKVADDNIYRVKSLHKIELRDAVLTESDVALCLAPLTGAFLIHFPEVLDHLDQIQTTTDWQGASVDWSIAIKDKDGVSQNLRWKTRPVFARALSSASLRMWPPGESPDWHLYAAYGTGKKKDCGRWHLLDEKGRTGELIDINEEEYFTVLRPSEKASQDTGSNGSARTGQSRDRNRPRSLLLRDNDNKERGIIFLSKFQDQTTSGDGRATLAVDFGTSNTCLAFNDGDSQVLNFSLTPEMLWGKHLGLESPGFVPFEWGGQKGFFPTILLSRISDAALRDDLDPERVRLEHLFKVDIPGLHKGMEEKLNAGEFNKIWKPHTNLKWETQGTKPWRTLFLQLTLLYAHAELFFNWGVKPDTYVFTFPRAFPLSEQESYHSKVQSAVRKIRHYCYGTNYSSSKEDDFHYFSKVDESTAIAEQIRSKPNPALMDVFIDIGGGTADIAIRHNGQYLVLDSIRVAGESFFRFAEKNFSEKQELHGAPDFKRHLRRLLQGQDDGAPYRILNTDKEFRLGVTYSVAINALDDTQFRDREAAILKKTMGSRSYQKYRTKLFLRHILAYALVQACAAVIERKLKLSSGLKLVLGGNGWGLMVFAEMPRSAKKLTEEAHEILSLLKRELSPTLDEEERACLDLVKTIHLELLNESDLSAAKTSVALGALKASAKESTSEHSVTPFAGVTVKNLQINRNPAATIRWCDRWGFDEFKRRYGFMDSIEQVLFESCEDQEKPMDALLSVFTCVGNTQTNKEDNMPGNVWISLNSELSEHINDMHSDRVEQVPINFFVSDILYPRDSARDFLDTLAAKNGQYRTKSDEE